MDNEELKLRIKSLFWNICHQREKVNGNLTILVEELYPDFDAEQRYKIREKILRNMINPKN